MFKRIRSCNHRLRKDVVGGTVASAEHDPKTEMCADVAAIIVSIVIIFIIVRTFLPREAMLSVVYAVVVCLCVCVCVCLSHSGIVSKRLNVGTRKQRRMIAP